MEKLVEFLDFSKRYVSWVLDFKNCSELNWTSYCSEILVVQTESSFTFEEVLTRMYILLLINGISKFKVLSFAPIFQPRLNFNIHICNYLGKKFP